jgi:hypothetical protein
MFSGSAIPRRKNKRLESSKENELLIRFFFAAIFASFHSGFNKKGHLI